MEQHIITRFGVPTTLVFDNATYFSSLKLTEFSLEKWIILKYAAKYYPQWNDLVVSINKNLICILKWVVVDQQRNWNNALPNDHYSNFFVDLRQLTLGYKLGSYW